MDWSKEVSLKSTSGDELCPLPCIEFLLRRYFWCRHPKWMMCAATVPFENLRTLCIVDLPCWIQLPDGLCRLQYLEFLKFDKAPAIKHVRCEFVQPHSHHDHLSSGCHCVSKTARDHVDGNGELGGMGMGGGSSGYACLGGSLYPMLQIGSYSCGL